MGLIKTQRLEVSLELIERATGLALRRNPPASPPDAPPPHTWVAFPDMEAHPIHPTAAPARACAILMTAKTTAERQAAYRARKAQIGLVEVRGIFAPIQDHPAIKRFAKTLVETQGKT